MLDRSLARRLALGRLSIGTVMLSAPAAAAGPLVPAEEADRPWTKLLGRMLGVREIALALLILRSLRSKRDERLILALAALCDLVDGLAALADAEIPAAARATFAGVALPTAAIELLMVAGGLD
jgi:hypothetical protein